MRGCIGLPTAQQKGFFLFSTKLGYVEVLIPDGTEETPKSSMGQMGTDLQVVACMTETEVLH